MTILGPKTLINDSITDTFKIPRYFEIRRRALAKIEGHLVAECQAKLGATVCIRQFHIRKGKKGRDHNFNPLKFYIYLDYFKEVGGGRTLRTCGRYFMYDIENPVDDFEGELRAPYGLLLTNPNFRFLGVWLGERDFAANFRVVVEPAEIVLPRKKKVDARSKYIVNVG